MLRLRCCVVVVVVCEVVFVVDVVEAKWRCMLQSLSTSEWPQLLLCCPKANVAVVVVVMVVVGCFRND